MTFGPPKRAQAFASPSTATGGGALLTMLPDVSGSLEHARCFASPFDEIGPQQLARDAAETLQAELRSGRVADGVPACGLDEPRGGKMFGVLVVEDRDGRRGFLRAFSGMLDGRFDVPGYVPAIFDRDARAAVELPGEAVVKQLLARAAAFASSDEVVALRRAEADMTTRHAAVVAQVRERHAAQRAARRLGFRTEERSETKPRNETTALRAQQSRRDKAERRTLDAAHAAERRELDVRIRRIDRRLAAFERLRHLVCRRLMRRIHETYRIVNANGEVRGLRDLYAPGEPPAGAGDCVAPKLLAYAFERGLRPLAMAEFWWGAPPASGGRIAGAYYPACREKCGPLLAFMMEGLDVAPPRRFAPPHADVAQLRVVFADAWIVVVDKPAGLLSVPGRGAVPDDSVQAQLRREHPEALLVHRLDLDTSGLLVAARDMPTYVALQRQFLGRTVEKRYAAIVRGEVEAEGGVIDLPIRVDLDDRPRQIHDPVHGRRAVTKWRRDGLVSPPIDGEDLVCTRVRFFPLTGRTHQLRVHAAHPLGLGAPILGDRLYGHTGRRLMLHAEGLTFDHPATGERVSFDSSPPF